MKVMTIAGTRPELIRLSRVLELLDKHVQHVFVHTGQNYDYELNEIFFKELEIRKPDHFLDVDRSSLGRMLGSLFVKIEALLLDEKPDAILILGDTNSAMTCVMARRMRIPVFHMEAGNRSFDLNIPEEINRRIVDHTADVNIVYTEHARRNLLAEGLPPRQIYLSGSPMCEVLDYYADKIASSTVLEENKLTAKAYITASIHREENVDNKKNLASIISVLEHLNQVYKMPVLISTHPRTRERLSRMNMGALPDGLHFHKPFGFFDYVTLQKNSFCVVSDSGTVSEEAALLNFPAVTIRNSMERPEAMDHGNVVLCGLKPDAVQRAVEAVVSISGSPEIPSEYLVKNCSVRVLRILLGTVDLLHRWNGIELQDLQAGA
jgi:UDP-N-acetyl-L-fucosamine synthase